MLKKLLTLIAALLVLNSIHADKALNTPQQIVRVWDYNQKKMLSYYTVVLKDTDVNKSRNLAKSVTVE